MKSQIRSLEDIIDFQNKNIKPLVLFSGGLDGSFLIWWLQAQGFKNVHALSVGVGGDEDITNAQNIARKLGAITIYEDLASEFASQYVALSIQAQSRYLNQHPLSASLSRPLIAKTAIRVAKQFSCNMIIHSATLSQNSLRRFNGALRYLGYQGIYGSPYEYSSISREEKIALLRPALGDIFSSRSMSIDTNLWCREFEAGILDNAENIEIPEEMFLWTAPRGNKSKRSITIEFKHGMLNKIDGTAASLIDLIHKLQFTIGEYGFGRYISLEELPDGRKFPEIRESPAAYILFDAYKQLEAAIFPSETIREKMILEQVWVKEAAEGRWFSPLHTAATSFINTLGTLTSGVVSYILTEKNILLNSIKVENPLYHYDRDVYEKEVIEASRIIMSQDIFQQEVT